MVVTRKRLLKKAVIRMTRVTAILLLLSNCGKETEKTVVMVPSNDREATVVPNGALKIEGLVVNGEDPDNTTVLADQDAVLVRSDGVVVSQTTISADGSYEFNVAPGGLVIDGSYSLTQDETETETPSYTFELQIAIPDDGNGKALGIKQQQLISAEQIVTDENGTQSISFGTSEVKEISAILGKVTFADAGISVAGVDAYIPGLPYFVRTGDDGSFNLLFVPQGTYNIRLEKSPYIKDVSVTVANRVTTNLGTVTFSASDRNPLALNEVILGTWNVKCYYLDTPGGISPENPRSGQLIVNSVSNVALTGDSCIMRNFAAAPADFDSFIFSGNGAMTAKFVGGSYYIHSVNAYTNSEITWAVDGTSLGSGVFIEVWSRALE